MPDAARIRENLEALPVDLIDGLRARNAERCRCGHVRSDHYEDRALPFEADGPRIPDAATRCGPCHDWHDYEVA